MELNRRTLLRASVIGVAGSIAGRVGASENRQETQTTNERTQETTTVAQDPDETIVLGGQVEYWYGVAPSSIQGRENPMLAMEPGTVYEVVWVNLDGEEHELRIFDGNDEVVAATESASEVGETGSVVLEATEQLARYDCEYHPESMRGQVRTEAGGTTAGTTTTTTESGGPY
ncbi:hypothetical protein M0R89_00120 [Halorussus limi]|uniref:Copper binding plastocyanin/azurin family protein n=1 Tax=Halorussus limi TaxID=2938695 RepID=A0A8U0HTS0_9EURY|nr:hypothetical protein [Halorussus limi]UPV74492.1 hypothetical protein M0R89_00120 [Halorussus limi]